MKISVIVPVYNCKAYVEKLEDPKQVVSILRNYLVAPERIMRIVAAFSDYSLAMLELSSIPTEHADRKQDIPVCRRDSG